MSGIIKKAIATMLVATAITFFSGVSAVYKTVNVPQLSQQPYENACWATTGASICRFKGKNVTKEQFAVKAGKPLNELQEIDVVEDTFGKYGIDTLYESGYLPFSYVQEHIDDGKTMYINVHGHAVALRGYRQDSTSGSLDAYTYFMDPRQGSYTFTLHSKLITGAEIGYTWREALTEI